jgi:hypothetical protein
MTQLPSQKSPAERALDLAVYGPLGLALSIAEAMPAMARKGRSRLGPQVGLARSVGQLAVQQGFRQLRGMATSGPGTALVTRRPANTDGAAQPDVVAPPCSASRPDVATQPVPGAAELAIPSYDSLSASQVVQRLAGLSHDEVAAVRAYEAATRGRRTVLSRAEQLLG